jgi:hypothetical protein
MSRQDSKRKTPVKPVMAVAATLATGLLAGAVPAVTASDSAPNADAPRRVAAKGIIDSIGR